MARSELLPTVTYTVTLRPLRRILFLHILYYYFWFSPRVLFSWTCSKSGEIFLPPPPPQLVYL